MFEHYLLGESDGQPKHAAWAAAISGIDADDDPRAGAPRSPGKRALITVSHSLQRAEHGEQPVWMGMVLAAVLGQIGLPGGGYAYALGAIGHYGRRVNAVPGAALPQGRNGVARLHPGGAHRRHAAQSRARTFATTARRCTYPDIRLVYWAGGNPFHHHQDLNRLRQAFARLDTFVVHELAWTATARHADIVLPCDHDAGARGHRLQPTDPLMVAMHRVAEPFGEARDDYAIFADLAERLGARSAFTEGRTSRQWLRASVRADRAPRCAAMGLTAPDFDDVLAARRAWSLPQQPDDGGTPARASATIPRRIRCRRRAAIEIYSPTIAGLRLCRLSRPSGLADADRVPEPGAPLLLVANQPATRLHSQLDFGGHQLGAKHRGREVARMHPDAMPRRAASPTATSSACSTSAAPASPRVRRHRRHRARRRAAADRRLVRPGGSRGRSAALRARQSRTC